MNGWSGWLSLRSAIVDGPREVWSCPGRLVCVMHEAATKLPWLRAWVAAVDLGERDKGPMRCTPSASWAGVAGKWLCWGPTPATGDNSIQYHRRARWRHNPRVPDFLGARWSRNRKLCLSSHQRWKTAMFKDTNAVNT